MASGEGPEAQRLRIQSHLCDGAAPAERTIFVDTTAPADLTADAACVDALLATRDADHPGRGADGHISFGEALGAIRNDAIRRPGTSYVVRFALPHGSTIDAFTFFEIRAPNVTIDGDMDGDQKPDIAFLGADRAATLVLSRDHIVLRHLALQGVVMEGAASHDNAVSACYIGTDVDGAAASAQKGNGILISAGAHHNRIESNVVAGRVNGTASGRATGIFVFGGNDNVIENNLVGQNAIGFTVPNEIGIAIVDGARNRVGGSRAGPASSCLSPCNLISGNLGNGIILRGPGTTGNTIEGNFLGTDATGTASRPNGTDGAGWPAIDIDSGAFENIIGGDRGATTLCTGPCNLISGNGEDGVFVGAGSGNRIHGNYIGLAIDGSALRNVENGIWIEDAAGTTIGIGGVDVRTSARCDGRCNVISGNGASGIVLDGSGTTDTKVRANWIGSSPDGLAERKNGADGIRIQNGAHHNQIGDVRAVTPRDYSCRQRCNLIAWNGANGVTVMDGGTRASSIRGNEIRDNGGLGIDLGNDGVSKSMAEDAAQPNDRISFPAGVTSHLDRDTNMLRVSGILETDHPADAVIDFYINPRSAADQRKVREAREYLGSVKPDPSGGFTESFPLGVGPLPPLGFISATATNKSSSTSEISRVCGDTDGNGNPDNDGDGLCDDWEVDGIDFDDDGNFDLDLKKLDPVAADRDVKDVFVEIDYELGHPPFAADLERVERAFANAPAEKIVLHWIVDESLSADRVASLLYTRRGPGEHDDLIDIRSGSNDPAKAGVQCGVRVWDGHFGTPIERGMSNCLNVLGARRLVFRYLVMPHVLTEYSKASGAAVFGSNFIVPSNFGSNTDAATSAYMHELGHTLGLCHGGPLPSGVDDCRDARAAIRDVNFKPNYLSVMNYLFQNRKPHLRRPLDYSRWVLPQTGSHELHEDALDEMAGITGGPAPSGLAKDWGKTFFTYWDPASAKCRYEGVSATGAINWNRVNDIERSVAARINDSDDDPQAPAPHPCMPTTPGMFATPAQTLAGYEDWPALRFNFRYSTSFVTGLGATSSPEMEIGLSDLDEEQDFDGDGKSDATDNCPLIANPLQEPGTHAGIGAACDFTISVAPSTVVGGSGKPAVTITLMRPAPPAGAELEIFSGDRAVVQMPSLTVKLPASTSSTSFDVTTRNVRTPANVPIIAHYTTTRLSADLTVIPDPTMSADVGVSVKESHDPVTIHNVLTYLCTIRNDGPLAANDIAFTAVLPDGLTLVSVTPDQGTCSGGAPIRCALGRLTMGSVTRVTIVVEPAVIGTVLFSAAVSAAEADANSVNDTAEESTTVGDAICTPLSRDRLLAWWTGNLTFLDAAGKYPFKPPAPFLPAKVSAGFRFYGGDPGTSVLTKDDEDLTASSAGLTVELWFRGAKDQISPNGIPFTLADWYPLEIGNGYWLITGDKNSGKLKFTMKPPAGPSAFVESAADLLDDRFHHIAAEWEADTIRLYVDGVLQPGTATVARPTPGRAMFSLGYSKGGLATDAGSYFVGMLDEITLYGRALTKEEIGAIFVAGIAGRCRAETRLRLVSSDAVSPFPAAGKATYKYEITNDGPNAAGEMLATYHLPAEMKVITCSASAGGLCGTSAEGPTVRFDSLAAGASATVEFTLQADCTANASPPLSSPFSLELCVTSDTPGSTSVEGRNCVMSSLTVAGNPDLHLVTSTLSAPVAPESKVPFRYTLTAGSAARLAGCGSVLLWTDMPAGWKALSASSDGGTCSINLPGEPNIVCKLEPVGPRPSCPASVHESISVSVLLMAASSPGHYEHIVRVACLGSGADPAPGDNDRLVAMDVCPGSRRACIGGRLDGQECPVEGCPGTCVWTGPDPPPGHVSLDCYFDFQCPIGYVCAGGGALTTPYCGSICPKTSRPVTDGAGAPTTSQRSLLILAVLLAGIALFTIARRSA